MPANIYPTVENRVPDLMGTFGFMLTDDDEKGWQLQVTSTYVSLCASLNKVH